MSSPQPSQQRKRTAEEIMSAILTVAAGCTDTGKRGASRMKIMADAFISFGIATEYLGKLQREGLVEYHAETHSYLTTGRGKQLLYSHQSAT
jgi:predicted transcriptional regulator